MAEKKAHIVMVKHSALGYTRVHIIIRINENKFFLFDFSFFLLFARYLMHVAESLSNRHFHSYSYWRRRRRPWRFNVQVLCVHEHARLRLCSHCVLCWANSCGWFSFFTVHNLYCAFGTSRLNNKTENNKRTREKSNNNSNTNKCRKYCQCDNTTAN